MDPHGHSKPTRRIRALGFSLPIMMHLVGVADERQIPKLNRRFRSATADVVALEVGVDIAADS